MSDARFIVIGGGVVGAAISYGLARLGHPVTMIDGADDAFRASRANFGLVWVQSKGLGKPDYAAWSRRSAALYEDFRAELEDESGVDCAYHRPGGVTLALSDDELEEQVAILAQIREEAPAGEFEFEVVERARLDNMLPGLGPEVVGATYSAHDGEANSLFLLHALHGAFQRRGGAYVQGHHVSGIEAAAGGGYAVTTADGTVHTGDRVVVAAGLGNQELAARVGLEVPVRPVQGQVIVTERADPLLAMPTLNVKQTREGTFMLGASQAEVDYDITTDAAVLKRIAERNLRAFPFLSDLRVVRSWAGLRVMTPDGFPIYDQSPSHPGVFIATGHSGVTTAAAHAYVLADHFSKGEIGAELTGLSGARFHVQA